MTHNHWTIIGYKVKKEHPNQPGYFFDGVSKIKVIANSEEDALAEAAYILKRKGYVVEEVYSCDIDHNLDQEMHLLQMKQMQAMLKKL